MGKRLNFKEMNDCKVMVLAFHKTGTTSLKKALEALGYNVCDFKLNLAQACIDADFEKVWEVADQHDAYQDNPWAVIYKEMDVKYPGSKFILIQRDPVSWATSIQNYFGEKETLMREFIYGKGFGTPIGNEELYLERYKRHNREVLAYFKDRPQDLLILDLIKEKDQLWSKICTFLDKPIPRMAFPHANKGNRNKNGIAGFLDKVKNKVFG
jgi:hypothetical protein